MRVAGGKAGVGRGGGAATFAALSAALSAVSVTAHGLCMGRRSIMGPPPTAEQEGQGARRGFLELGQGEVQGHGLGRVGVEACGDLQIVQARGLCGGIPCTHPTPLPIGAPVADQLLLAEIQIDPAEEHAARSLWEGSRRGEGGKVSQVKEEGTAPFVAWLRDFYHQETSGMLLDTPPLHMPVQSIDMYIDIV